MSTASTASTLPQSNLAKTRKPSLEESKGKSKLSLNQRILQTTCFYHPSKGHAALAVVVNPISVFNQF